MTRPGPRPDRLGDANAAIGLAVGLGAAASPRTLLRLYGAGDRPLTGLGDLGWRLFAVRNLVVGVAALRGSEEARRMFLPVQVLDQLAFLHALRAGVLPGPSAALAVGTSSAIVALDLARRRRRRAGRASR